MKGYEWIRGWGQEEGRWHEYINLTFSAHPTESNASSFAGLPGVNLYATEKDVATRELEGEGQS